MPVNIQHQNQKAIVVADKYVVTLDSEGGYGEVLDKNGIKYFSFPLDVQLTLRDSNPSQMPMPLRCRAESHSIELSSTATDVWASQNLTFTFEAQHFTVSYSAVAANSARVSDCFYFLRGNRGMNLNTMYEGFTPAPTGGRNGEEDLYSFTPAGTAYSYYTPSPLNVGLGFPNGWVGIGLVDLPNGDGISVEDNWSLKVDMPSGHLPLAIGEVYTAPRVMVTFPEHEWDGITEYRRVLVEAGLADNTPVEKRSLPDWWKTPMYCTYGDQIVEMQPFWITDWHWDDPMFTSDWVRNAIKRTERRLGYKDFTVIVDAFWMDRWDADPKPSSRFPDMRALVDWCHERGHKVLLWYFPMITHLNDGKGSDARRFGVLPPGTPSDAKEAPIDFTSPNFPAYAEYVAKKLFGDGDVEFNADGVKLDFLAYLPHPQDTQYQYPSAGMGIRALHRWLTVFGEAARAVKQDVCINWSAADPHFDGLFSSNSTHDTHFSPLEFERRARISALAAPDTMVNFDGCLMRGEWADACYLPAAIYGTPSLYYSKTWHGAVEIPDEQLHILGRLFELSAKRPWGRPVFRSYGNWQLESDGRIVAETVDSKALILFPEDGKGHVFSMANERISLPLHGRTVQSVSPQPRNLRVSAEAVTAEWDRGLIYNLSLEEQDTCAKQESCSI